MTLDQRTRDSNTSSSAPSPASSPGAAGAEFLRDRRREAERFQHDMDCSTDQTLSNNSIAFVEEGTQTSGQ